MKIFWTFILLLLSPTLLAKERLTKEIYIDNTVFKKCSEVRITKAIFFKILDLGLYLPDCSVFKGISSKSDKVLRFAYLRKVKGSELKQGANEFLKKNLSKEELDYCKNEYQQLNDSYKNVSKGDVYQLHQDSSNSITVTLNDSMIGSISEERCAINYYQVWFGKEYMDSGFSKLENKALKKAANLSKLPTQ